MFETQRSDHLWHWGWGELVAGKDCTIKNVQCTQGTIQTIHQHISEMGIATHNSDPRLFRDVG